jgi:hypothetical protein
MSPRRKRKPITAWEHWQKAETALRAVEEEMQSIARRVAAEPPATVSGFIVADVRRDVRRFLENFELLVREQKRTVASR